METLAGASKGGEIAAPVPGTEAALPLREIPRGRFHAFVVALVLLAAGVRFFRLGEWSLETDEAFMIHDSLHTLTAEGGLSSLAFPVGYAFEWLTLRGARPLREFDARLGPAIAGSLTVGAAAIAFAPAVGRGAALLGAALLAIAPWHIYWSQFARYYALLALLVVAAQGFFYRGLEKGRALPLVLAAAFLAFAVGTHPSAGFLFPALALFPLLLALGRGFRGQGRFPTNSALLLASLALLLAGVLLPPVRDAFGLHRLKKREPSPVLFLSTLAYWARPPLLAAAACSAFAGLRRRHPGVLYLSLAAFGPIAAGFAASLLARANAQYVFCSLPALLALVGWGVIEVARAGRRVLAVGLLGAVAADLAAETALYFGPHGGHRAAWREACAFVWENAVDGDVVASSQAPIVEFYLHPGWTYLRSPERVFLLSPWTLAEFEKEADRRGRTWYLYNDADLDDWPREERERLRSRLREASLLAEWPRRIVTDDLGVKVYREDT